MDKHPDMIKFKKLSPLRQRQFYMQIWSLGLIGIHWFLALEYAYCFYTVVDDVTDLLWYQFTILYLLASWAYFKTMLSDPGHVPL